jgi:ABC-type uncharacterized transport system ATPase subunit
VEYPFDREGQQLNTDRVAIMMSGITKHFAGVAALDGVDLEIRTGEIRALLGENGAGKTTLMNVLTGLYLAEHGSVTVFGQPMPTGPQAAIEAGIAVVPQHFEFIETESVARNLALVPRTGEAGKFFLRIRGIEAAVVELSARYGLEVDPLARVDSLTVGQQQRVAILKALYQGAQILVLDEPTSMLTPQESEALFDVMRQMTREGKTVIFISHKLEEVLSVADWITVLRRGQTVATLPARVTDRVELIRLMVGHDVGSIRREGEIPQDAPVVLGVTDLHVRGDRGNESVRGVSLSVRAGEIVAVAGVEGNGQDELVGALIGLRSVRHGIIEMGGQRLPSGKPSAAIAAGIGYVPEDRRHTGSAAGLPLAPNAVLRSVSRYSLGPLLRWSSIRRQAAELVADFGIKVSDPQAPVSFMSGGNLQRLVVGRELASQPKLLIIVSPTQGLDVDGIQTVHRLILQAAEQGLAVLLVSKDLEEIRALAHRVVVMYGGELTEVDRTANNEAWGRYMTGAHL